MDLMPGQNNLNLNVIGSGLESIQDRMEIRNHVQNGDIESAIEVSQYHFYYQVDPSCITSSNSI